MVVLAFGMPVYSWAQPEQQLARSKCPWNDRVYRSLPDELRPDVYQTFRFMEGTSGGTARISEYRDGSLAWVLVLSSAFSPSSLARS